MKARALTLYETYTRQEVHDIFDPGTPFTPQAGTWGLWGIVPVPAKAGDFVFFVTFGKEQAGHHFDEWVGRYGIINWQSQPRQGLADRQIQQFIQHDPARNNIYLFLRTNKSVPYTYLGRLAYHAHDPKRERPVYIQWQILDWNPPLAHLQAMGLTLRLEEPQLAPESAETVSFEWRGVQYPVDLDQLGAIVQRHIQAGLPAEALRFRDWYVEIGGQRVSPKWIFHLITDADYGDFDAPTARDKLEQIGLSAKFVVSEPEIIQLPLEVEGAKHKVKEQGMYKAKYYKEATVRAFVDFLNDLTLIGEIPYDQRDAYWLTDYHFLDIMRSTLVLANPLAFVASPKLINSLPLENIGDLIGRMNLSTYYGDSWPMFSQRAFNLQIAEKYPQIEQRFSLYPVPETIFEDQMTRPVFFYNYFSGNKDWEEWTIDSLFKLHRVYTEPRLFVHSVLPIQNLYGGLPEAQNAVWKSALFWVMIQLIILSDPQTGAVYDPKIHLALSDGWKDHSLARLYLQEEYLGDLVDCLEPLLGCFNWIWVNRTGDPTQDQQAILGIFRLLLKLDMAELGKNGRVQFTDGYRSRLFESQEKARLAYQGSKDARDQVREAIKEMSR